MARTVKYPAQISALVSQEVSDRVARLAETHAISVGEVIREALAEGLTSVDVRYAALAEQGSTSQTP